MTAVILAFLIIAAVTGIILLFSIKTPEFKIKKQKQGTKRKTAVKGGIAINNQQNGFFLKNMELKNTIHIGRPESRKRWNVVFYDLKTGRVVFKGSFYNELLVGRENSSGGKRKAVLCNAEISKEHCIIRERKGKLFLTDLNSKNHTYLNGKLVVDEELLKDGDILSLGNIQIQISLNISF